MADLIVRFLAMAGVIYILLCGFLYLMQSRMLYYPKLAGRDLTVTPDKIGLDYEDVTLVTGDNVRIHGWFVQARQSRGTILFFHGNAGNISHRLDTLRIFNQLGLSTLIIDYRGYGRSEGSTTEQGTYLDAEAAWTYLIKNRGIDPQQIIFFGRSLGGAIAAHLATKHPPAGLILESTFTSVPDMAAKLYPFLPVRLLSRYNYNTREAVQKVTSPVLIIHSPDDEIIPYENGVEIFAAANEPKSFLKIRGGHNDGFMVSGPDYYEGLERFVAECLRKGKEFN